MNKEELIGKLQMCYFGDRNALNELVGYYDGLKQGIEQIQHQLEQERNIRKEAIKFIKQELSQGGPREIRDLVDGYELLEILNKEVK